MPLMSGKNINPLNECELDGANRKTGRAAALPQLWCSPFPLGRPAGLGIGIGKKRAFCPLGWERRGAVEIVRRGGAILVAALRWMNSAFSPAAE